MHSYSILLVDDEQYVLNSLLRTFRNEKNWSVEAYSDPLEALKRIRCSIFDVVISDCKMPEVDGLEFLKELREIQPDAIRILLTGSLSPDVLLGAINKAGAFRFLHKPWEDDSLISVVKEGLRYRDVLVENRMMAARLKELEMKGVL